MAAVGALELARKVGDLGRVLRAGFQVAQLDLALVELVAHHDREVGTFARRPLQLARKRPWRQIRGSCHTGGAQLGRELETSRSRARVGANDDRDRMR